MKVTFFVGSVVGYVENPSAILTRGLAHGLSLRGNEVRVVEERQNREFAKTLRVAGAGASRHFYESFRMFQHHTYEPRSGAPLLEWVTRELALIDVAVVVDGAGPELCRWIANVSQEGLTRAFLTFQPERLTQDVVTALELGSFEIVLSPAEPSASIVWRQVAGAIAGPDRELLAQASLPRELADEADPIRAAEVFEAAVARVPSVDR